MINIKILKPLLVLALMLIIGQVANSQEDNNGKDALVEDLIESKNFVFAARSATPMGGRFIALTSYYDLLVAGDSIKSNLPYYGRSFVAIINPMESPLRFTSTEFGYKAKKRKRGGWDITITPKDGKDVRQMYMTVSSDGYATLQINSNNRQSISFSGTIRQRDHS